MRIMDVGHLEIWHLLTFDPELNIRCKSEDTILVITANVCILQ